MKKTELTNKLSRGFHKVGFKLKKHSPEILVGVGIIGGVASAVMACKATLKVHEVLDEAKNNIEDINEATEKGITLAGEEYTEQDRKKDLACVYTQSGLKMLKLYGPAIVTGVAATTSVLAGYNIMKKRYVATAAAYAIVDKSFKDYRSRVVERFGKEIDHELRHNIKAVEVEETVVDEKGKEKVVKKTIEVTDNSDISEYARFFEDGCKGWEKDPEWNLKYLLNLQRFCNERLETVGYLFLNEVYEELGIPRTQAGQIVGWVYDPSNPNIDSQVDFGIHDLHKPANRSFVNGWERTILLDFNVDGPIVDKI